MFYARRVEQVFVGTLAITGALRRNQRLMLDRCFKTYRTLRLGGVLLGARLEWRVQLTRENDSPCFGIGNSACTVTPHGNRLSEKEKTTRSGCVGFHCRVTTPNRTKPRNHRPDHTNAQLSASRKAPSALVNRCNVSSSFRSLLISMSLAVSTHANSIACVPGQNRGG